MKLNKYFMLGLAGLAFAACSNEDGLPGNGDDGSAKSLIISISGISSSAGTKAGASDMTPGWTPDTNNGKENISKLTLFFTDGTGTVKHTYQAVEGGENTSEFSALLDKGVKFVGLDDVSAVYAVANKDITTKGITNINQLSTALSNQGISSTAIAKNGSIYVGGTTDITPLQADDSSITNVVDLNDPDNSQITPEPYSYTANIHLVPIISRIQIKSIKVHSSGTSNAFPADAIGTVTKESLVMTWNNFKPALYGIYLNRFHNQFNDLLGTTGLSTGLTGTAISGVNYLYNKSFNETIKEGKWLFDTDQDMAANAAYINYTSNAYAALKNWGNEDQGYCTLDMGKTGEKDNCIAFNIFVPFDITKETVTPRTIMNPTIHFQFGKDFLSGSAPYSITFKHVNDNNALTADEEAVANASEYNINYTMPQTNDYLFANITKLYSEEGTTSTASDDELVLAPGKIYNMDVVIEPVNMTVDLEMPTSYNVIVKITVQDFTEANIYPGFE